MTPEQHISAAVAHLNAAMAEREEAYTKNLHGAPLLDFDAHGQALWYQFREIVHQNRISDERAPKES